LKKPVWAVGNLLPAPPAYRSVRCSHSGATLCQEFRPYLAGSPGTEGPALHEFRLHMVPATHDPSRARRLTACHRFPKAPGRTADVHQVSQKMARAISWPERVNRRVV